MKPAATHLTRAYIHLDRLTHNVRLLQRQVGERPMWPCIKAGAYGHGAEIVARHLLGLGYDTFCVATVVEAAALRNVGIGANFIVLSATLPEHSAALVAYDCEPAICSREMAQALAQKAAAVGKRISIHLMVDTGMGRIGIRPEEVEAFIEWCRGFPSLHVRAVMSHFPCADERDKGYSLAQLERFNRVVETSRALGVDCHHMANSAAILDLPTAHLDAVRPGIAIYGLRPSRDIVNPLVHKLQPVLEWKTRITFLKEVAAGEGLSYGHAYITDRPSLIATVPVGYADGLARGLSNNMDFLVHGVRCPQVGRVTMDMSLIDVTALRGQVSLGDDVVLVGQQEAESLSADELAERLGTINYEITTRIGHRVPRIAVGD